MTDQLLTPQEAAAYCRVSLSFLSHKRIEGGGPDFIKIGMKVSYRKSDLDDWLTSHTIVRQPSCTQRQQSSSTTPECRGQR